MGKNEKKEAVDDDYDKFNSIKMIYDSVNKDMIEWRDTTYKLSVLYVTFTSAVVAWIYTRSPEVDELRSLFIVAGMSIITAFVSGFIRRLEVYFGESASVINRCQYILGAYTDSHFSRDYGPFGTTKLLPDKWLEFGRAGWKEPIFAFCNRLIWIMFGFALVSVATFSPWDNRLIASACRALEFASWVEGLCH